MDPIVRAVIEKGDLAHLALFLWASGASSLLALTMRENALSNRRFNDFVKEVAKLTSLFNADKG